MKMSVLPAAMKRIIGGFANFTGGCWGSLAGDVVTLQDFHALKFLLLDLLLFGDKLLRNSGQLFKSKSTSLVVL